MKETIFCKCESYEHHLIFAHDEDSKEVYVAVNLIPHKNILKRLWTAIKYVFGHKSRFGQYDEFLLKPEDLKKIAEILKKRRGKLNPLFFLSVLKHWIVTFVLRRWMKKSEEYNKLSLWVYHPKHPTPSIHSFFYPRRIYQRVVGKPWKT